MPGPPDDVPPADLFLKLQETPAPTEVVNFPRKTSDGKPIGTVRLRVLRGDDHDVARLRAKARLKEKYKLTDDDFSSSPGDAILRDATAREVLAMACLTEKSHGGEEQGAPFYPLIFRDPDSIGKQLSSDEITVLLQSYLLVQTKYGPWEKTVQTDEDLNAWIKRLVEGAAEFPLRHLSSVHWGELACLLAQRAYTLSAILECLFESLPRTLKSRLGAFSMGTGFYGRRAAGMSADGTATSRSEEIDTLLKIPNVQITIEDAKEMAAALQAAEEAALAELDAADELRG